MHDRIKYFLAIAVAAAGIPVVAALAQVTGASKTSHAKVLAVPMEDPIFGLEYQPDSVRFDPMPAQVSKLCADLPAGRWWVYAHARGLSADYYLVSGLIIVKPDGPGPAGVEPQEGGGTAVRIENARCTAQETGESLLAATVPAGGYHTSDVATEVLPGANAPNICDPRGSCHYVLRSADEEQTLRSLIHDALARYSVAFGEAAFRRRACTSEQLQLRGEESPVLGGELRRFCGGGARQD